MTKVRTATAGNSHDYAAYQPEVNSKTFNLTALMYPSGSASGKNISRPSHK